MKLMIITLGTGKDVQSGIAASIHANNPDRVMFVTTPESIEKNMAGKVSEIMNSFYHREMPYNELYEVEKADQVREVYDATLKAIGDARELGYSSENIYLDFTSGTKAMSVGASLAAFLNDCRTMVYISGSERAPDTGRVVTGSEIVMVFKLHDLHDDPSQPFKSIKEIGPFGPTSM